MNTEKKNYKNEIDTPALLIDLEAMDYNIKFMSEYFAGVKANLRPHFKTHKSPIIAHEQLEAGAIGITCAKLDEAQVLVESGIKNILIANQIVGQKKINRLLGLARMSDIIVAVDDKKNAEVLSEAAVQRNMTLNVIIERDVGMGRCGTRGARQSRQLAQTITSLPGLKFKGIMGYEGNCVMTTPESKRKQECQAANQILLETVEVIEKAGIEVEIISAGGTGTYDISGSNDSITEIQAGSYVTMDLKYKKIVPEFKPALSILASVISRSEKETAIIDTGMKAITKEFGLPEVKDNPDLKVSSLSEEHGKIIFDEKKTDLKVGDVIELLPGHGCTTFNLYDKVHGIRNNQLEITWDLQARGGFH